MTCQVDCQAKGFATCETKLEGGCKTACTKPDGALFCDGQYVDVGDQLDQCVADLKSLLQIQVKGYASGDAQCSNGSCTAEGKAGFSCAQAAAGAGDSSGNALGILGALAAFALAIGRRKNERV
jgi:MYXO-CTERM domain-containing protein